MVKNNLNFKPPNLEEIIEYNPLTISSESLIINAINRMNQSRIISLYQDSNKNKMASYSSYILVLEESKLAGILTERDIIHLTASAIDLKTITLALLKVKGE